MNDLSTDRAGGEVPVHHSTLDDLMADDLRENDIVMIDDVSHKFLLKVPHGPHVFWNGGENREERYGTVELLNLMAADRYFRPGRSGPVFRDDGAEQEHRDRIKVAFNAFPQEGRLKAKGKFLFVAKYRQLLGEKGGVFPRNEDNAAEVIKSVLTDVANGEAGTEGVILPRKVSPRTVLRWIAKEEALGLQESGLLHGNSVTPRPHVIPRTVYEIIAAKIRVMVGVSHKFGPTKILIMVKAAIDAHNLEHGTSLPYPSISTVQDQYRRYDAWIRLAREKGVAAADLEYGAIGKLPRPERILDLVEIDHHKFDLHPVTGDLGQTDLGLELAKGGLDRFWVCLALDVHSGYPLGFAITFEPGGLIPAVMCIDHAVRPKTYVSERWPDIKGDLLGFGKPVKVRYDNAKEFVSLQLQQNLARIGVGFELAIPGRPNSKPYVERHFGTIERDFVHWLKGSMGANIGEKGDRRPQREAAVNLDDFQMLFHQYLIEVLARRPQEGLDWDTPEQRWVRGASSPSHRPRPLTTYEKSRWDVVTTLELDLNATRDGIRWKNLFYQSTELQKLRRFGGLSGQRTNGPTPVTVRIPLLDIGKAYVAVPRNTPGFPDGGEIVVPATNPHSHGRTMWQHQAVCDWLRSKKRLATNAADYEIGFLTLFRNAMVAMGMDTDGDGGKVTLTGGQAPRFTGVYLAGAAQPAMARVRETMDRYDLLAEFAAGGGKENSLADLEDTTVPEPETQTSSEQDSGAGSEADWGAAAYDEDEQ
ncbi:DDE-type integrase/transposase/recombinase [Devosia faecipullorum]|uniref:DDE-type integrase/transposase/recombinase n=1 Tax=Devosia faecipullorum TaxID=2755039 RepID=UPI00187B4B49|nr:DDE-type integrase/transposase/recombinase [Devosia faecipullorum]MBE7731671.1 transposase family protein [Devosia faecipullorum]